VAGTRRRDFITITALGGVAAAWPHVAADEVIK